jgi:hypothetical protein
VVRRTCSARHDAQVGNRVMETHPRVGGEVTDCCARDDRLARIRSVRRAVGSRLTVAPWLEGEACEDRARLLDRPRPSERLRQSACARTSETAVRACRRLLPYASGTLSPGRARLLLRANSTSVGSASAPPREVGSMGRSTHLFRRRRRTQPLAPALAGRRPRAEERQRSEPARPDCSVFVDGAVRPVL